MLGFKGMKHKRRSKTLTAAFVAVSIFLTSSTLVFVQSVLTPAFSDEILVTPSQKGSGEIVAPQVVSVSSLKENETSILNVTLPKSATNSDSEMLNKHQLLVRVSTSNANEAGELNIATMNDWNVETRDTQSAAYKYPAGDSSFTTLVTVSDDYHLTAQSSTDVQVELTALAAFSDVQDADPPVTFTGLGDVNSVGSVTDAESDGETGVTMSAGAKSDAFEKERNGDYDSAKGELAPGGTKAITPIVLIDNKGEIGAPLQEENRVSVLGKSKIPHRKQNDPYPVRGVYLSVQTGDTEVTIDGNTVGKNANELVLVTVDEKGGVSFTLTNPDADIKITAVGYVGASFYNESQTVIEGGMVILGANAEDMSKDFTGQLAELDGVKGAAMLLSIDLTESNEIATSNEENTQTAESDITIDEIGNVDLTANLMIDVTGTVNASPDLKSIAIYADSTFITTANIDQTKTPARWFAKMTPGIGKANITAVARTYSSQELTASTNANGVNTPAPDTPIITDDANTLETDVLSRITKFYANSITFAGSQDIVVPEIDNSGAPIIDPNTGQQAMRVIDAGDIIVAKNDDASIATSFSRRVVAIDKFPSKIVFTTVNAALDEMYAQVNIQEEMQATPNDYVKTHPDLEINEEAGGVIEGTIVQEVTEEEYATMQNLSGENVTTADVTSEQSKILTNALFKQQNEQKDEPNKRIENAPDEPYTDEERALEESLLAQAKLIRDNTDANGKIINPSKIKEGFEEAQANDISLQLCANPSVKFVLKTGHITASIDLGVTLCGTLSIIIEFGLGLTLKYGFIPDLAYFHFRVGGSATLSFALEGKASAILSFDGPEITIFELMTNLVIMAILPFDISTDANIPFKPYAGVKGEITIALQWSTTASSIYTYDWSSKNGASDKNGTKESKKSSSEVPVLEGYIEILIGLRVPIKLTLGLFQIQFTKFALVPKVTFGIILNVSDEPKEDIECTSISPPCDELSLVLGLQFDFTVGFVLSFGLYMATSDIGIGFSIPLFRLGPFTINIPILTTSYEVTPWSPLNRSTPGGTLQDPSDDSPTPAPTPVPPTPPNPAYSGPGTVYGYGANDKGQIGNGATDDETAAYTLEPALGLSQTSKIVSSPSSDATYAIDAAGALYAWGDNSAGQLGRGYTGDALPENQETAAQKPANTPDKVVDSNGNPIGQVTSVAAFDGGGYALAQDGTVWAWGNNAYGQLGDGTNTSTNFAQKIPILNSVNTLIAGTDTGYAVRDDGSIWMFGRDITKASGNATVPIRITTISNANDNTALNFAANKNNLYFIIGSVIYGIGKNDGVTFGAGQPSYITTYASIQNQPDLLVTGGFQMLAANNETAYALGKDSRVYAWGKNDKGQFGNNATNNAYQAMTAWAVNTVQGTPSTEAVQITAGNGFAAAVMDDGTLMTWGNNTNAQLGFSANTAPQLMPKVTNASHISQISAGNKNLFVVKAIAAPVQNNGTLNSITYDKDGNTSLDQVTAIGVNSTKKAVSNSMGEFVLTKDGTVYKLSNVEGQSTKIQNTAREINKIVDIQASDDAVFALSESGFIYSWADSTASQTLGRIATSTADANMPAEINIVDETGINRCGTESQAGVDSFSAFGKRVFVACQINVGDTGVQKIIAWGDNTDQGAGIGTAPNTQEPVQVTAATGLTVDDTISSIQAGTHNTAILTDENKLLAFGETGASAINAAIQNLTASGAVKIVVMTASYGGFYFASDVGEVYAVGASVNTGSACSVDQTATATKVTGLADSFIIGLATLKTSDASTPDVILAQTDDSEVIAFGTDFKTPSTCESAPYNLLQIVNSVNVFAGESKAYVLTADYNSPAGLTTSGNLYAAGNNNNGQLGIDAHISQDTLETASSFLGKAISLATGNDSAGYAVQSDGTVLSFGDNSLGQRGIGDTSSNHDVTSQVIGLTNIVSLVASKNAAFALSSTGNVYTWGEMFNGDSYLVPQKLQTVGNIIQIAANNQYLYMVRSNGSVIRWDTNFNNSVEVLQSIRHVLQLAVTASTLLILKSPSIIDTTPGDSSDDSDNSAPPNIVQIADLNGENISIITTFPLGNDGKALQVTNIAASMDATSAGTEPTNDNVPAYYAVDKDSQLYSWGNNASRQANPDYASDTIATPMMVSNNITDANVAKVIAGKGVVYIVETDGTLAAFGTNVYGELAQGNQDVMTKVSKITGYGVHLAGVGPGSLFVTGSVAPSVQPTGRVYGMGDNTNDTLATGSTSDSVTQFTSLKCSTNNGTADCALPGIQKVVTNGMTTLALDESKNVWQWGKDFDSDLVSTEPTLISAVKNVKDIAIGANNAYILKTDTTVWAWGLNDKGQLGNNKPDITMLSKAAPQIVWGLYNVAKIGAGADAAFAKKTDGTTYSWGANDKHQLGLGANMLEDYYVSPQLMTALTGISVKEFAVGDETGYALTNFGEVYSWGEGSEGERGDGDVSNDIQYTATPHKISLQIGSGGDERTIFALHIASGGHTAYITGNDGFIYAWGVNDKNQLGTIDGEEPLTNDYMTSLQNTNIQSGTDALVSGRQGSSIVTAGSKGAFIINDDVESIGGWGDNSSGQLSLPTSTQSSATKQNLIKSYQTYPLSLAAGGNKVYIIIPIDPQAGTDTNIWAVGNNDKQQLAQGSGAAAASTKLLPVKAATDAEGVTAERVAAVGSTGAAALQDGRVLSWGENANGLLGRSATANSNLAEFVSAPAAGQQYLVAPNATICANWLCEVIDVAQTTSAFYVLTQGGAVYAWGNYRGSVKSLPTLVLEGATGSTNVVDKITRIDADGDRLIAWHEPADSDGEYSPQSVYAWTNQTEPEKFTIVTGDDNAIINAFVSKSAYYVTASTDAGNKLYTWGSNDNCALADTTSCTLGSGHTIDTPFIPTMLSNSGLNMLDVTVINNVNYAVDVNNKIWSWSGATGKFEPLINQTQVLGPTGFAGNGASAFIYTTCAPNSTSCSPAQVYATGANTYGQLGTGDTSAAPDWVTAVEYGTQLAVTSIAAGASGFSVATGVTPSAPMIGNTTMNYEQTAGDDFTLNPAIVAAPFPSNSDITIIYGNGFTSLNDIGLKLDCQDGECKITGTLQGEPGLYAFILTVRTLMGTVQQQYQIILDGAEPAFVSGSNNACAINAVNNTYPTVNIGDAIDIPICVTGTPMPDVSATSLPPGIKISAATNQADKDAGITHRIAGTVGSTAATSYASVITAKNAVIPNGVSINIAFSILQNPAINVPCTNIMEAGVQRCVINISTTSIVDIDLGILANPMPNLSNVSVTPQTTLDALGLELITRVLPDGQSSATVNHFILSSDAQVGEPQGKYVLTVTVNTGGTPLTQDFWLYIENQAPAISGSLSYNAVVGSEIYFPVTITGLPFPNIASDGYTKLVNGSTISGTGLPEFLHLDINGDGQAGSQTLDTLNDVVFTSRALRAEDIGVYTLAIRATNIVQSSVFYLTINITGADPVINIDDEITYFYDSTSPSKPEIDFTITGNPSPTAKMTDEAFIPIDSPPGTDSIPTNLFILDDGPSGYGPFSIFAKRDFKPSDVGEYTITLTAYNAMDPANGVEKMVTIFIAEKAAFSITGNTEYTVGDAVKLRLGMTGTPCPSANDITYTVTDNSTDVITNGTAGKVTGTCQDGLDFESSEFTDEGSYRLTFTATQEIAGDAGAVVNAVYGINIHPTAPRIKMASNFAVIEGTEFEETVQMTGNPCPIDANVTLTGAPSWITLEKTVSQGTFCDGAVIKGTAPISAAGAAYTLTVTASNQSGSTAQASTTLEIVGEEPAFHVTESKNGTVGKYFSLDLGVTGAPFPTVDAQPAQGLTVALPAGLSLYQDVNAKKWFIQGVPEKQGNTVFTLIATNSAKYAITGRNSTAYQNMQISISGSLPKFNPVGTMNLVIGNSVNIPLGVTGAPCPTVTIDPASRQVDGLQISGDCNGGWYLSGIVADSVHNIAGDEYDTKIIATNSVGTSNVILPLRLISNDSPPTITQTTDFYVTQTRYSSVNLDVQGIPCPSVTVDDVTKLPAGMYLVPNATCADPYGARIEGIPTGVGDYNFTVTATNDNATAQQTITVHVNRYAEAPRFYSATSAIGAEGDYFNMNLEISADPNATVILSAASSRLPAGLQIVQQSDGSTYIQGMPETGTSGTYNLALIANNGVAPNATHSITLTIAVDSVLPAFHMQNVAFTEKLDETFYIPLLVSGAPCPNVVASLISPASGQSVSDLGITGTCDASGFTLRGSTIALGTSAIRITATNPDDSTKSATQDITIIVASDAPDLLVPIDNYYNTGSYVSIPVQLIGNPIPTLSAQNLPDGLALTGSGRDYKVQGEIDANGDYTFTLTATNAANQTQIKQVALHILPNDLAFNIPTAGMATVGNYYSLPLNITGTPCPNAVTFADGSDALPLGLAITGSCTGGGYYLSGVLSNQATLGDYQLIFSINNGGDEYTAEFTLTVNGAMPMFYGADTATFLIGEFGIFDLDVAGSPNPTVAIASGTLPAGLTLQTIDLVNGDVAIIGTPTQNAPSDVQLAVKATNPLDETQYATKVITIHVVGEAPAYTVNPNISVSINDRFDYALGLTGSPCPASLQVSGTFPPGVNIAGTNCSTDPYRITGQIPILGTWETSVTASNAQGSAVINFTFMSTADAPIINVANELTSVERQFFAYDLGIMGSPCPDVTFTSNIAANGTAEILQAADGSCNFELIGEITEKGTYQALVTAENAAGSVTKAITLHVGGTAPEFHVQTAISSPEESFVKVPLNVTGDPSPTVSAEESSLPGGLSVQLINNAWYLMGTLADDDELKTYSIALQAKNVPIDNEVTTEITINFTIEEQKAEFDLPSDVYIAVDSYYELSFGLHNYNVRLKEGSALPDNMFLMKQSTAHKGWTIYGTPDQELDEPESVTFELLDGNSLKDTATLRFHITYSETPEFHPTGKISYLNSEVINISLGVIGTPAPLVTVIGTLPDGLALTGNAGNGYALQGQILEQNKYAIMLEACSTNEHDTICATHRINITITDATPVFNVQSQILLTIGVEKIIDLGVTGSPVLDVVQSSGILPVGLTFDDKTFKITGTPITAGESDVTFTATSTSNGISVSATKTIKFTVVSATPQFIVPAQEIVVLNEYTYIPISVVGNPCPSVTLTAESILPDGLEFKGSCDAKNAATYHISGAVTNSNLTGDYLITFSASNSDNPAETVTASTLIKVTSSAPKFHAPSSVAFVNDKFSYVDLGVTGSPYPNVEVDGATPLPDGLALVNDSVNRKTYIEGTPIEKTPQTCASPCTVTLTATDPDNATLTDTLELTILINSPEPKISLADQTDPIVTDEFYQSKTINLSVTGSPLPNINIPDNQLPSGFRLTGAGTATVAISGRSTHAGTYPIEITASNFYGTQTLLMTLVILGAEPRFSTENVVYLTTDSFASIDLGVTGGDNTQDPPTYPTVTLQPSTPLPAGLTLSKVSSSTPGNSKWIVSGTPTAQGTYDVMFVATLDTGLLSGSPVMQAMQINVSPSTPKFNANGIINGQLQTSATIDAQFSLDLSVTGNPKPKVSVVAGSLPPGLSITSDSKIVGIPTGDIQTYFVRLEADNGAKETDALELTIETVGQLPAFNSLSTVLSGTLGQVINIDLGITGYPFPSVTVQSGKLPDGISLICEDGKCFLRGQLQGTPNESIFTLQAQATVRTSTNTAASALSSDLITPYSLLITHSTEAVPLEETDYARSDFTFKTNALAPRFVDVASKVTANEHEYISVPLHYNANPCTPLNVNNLPKGLKVTGSCADGFQIQGIIDAPPATYGMTVTGENVAGAASENIQLVVGAPSVPKDTPTPTPTPKPTSTTKPKPTPKPTSKDSNNGNSENSDGNNGGNSGGNNYWNYGSNATSTSTPTPTPKPTISPTPTVSPTATPTPSDNAADDTIFGFTPIQFMFLALPIFLVFALMMTVFFFLIAKRRREDEEKGTGRRSHSSRKRSVR
jgi:alpha-tubulin suppressor-like RCC1 family protein